jgi:translocation and assembly module TamA
VLYEHSDIDNLVTYRSAAGATRVYVRERDGVTYDTKLTLNLQRELRRFDDVVGQPEETNTTLSATYRWTRREVDEVTDPRRGTILTLQGTVGVGQQLLESPIGNTFVAAYTRYVHYLAFPGLDPKNTQLIVRGELGRVFTDDPSIVPTDFLYRTGGAGTVRGYSYLSMGREPGTTNAGGTVLVVGSVETVHWFSDSWGGALFYDIGDAALSTTSFDFGQGAGFGVRFKTPAGPLALDLAYGKRRDDGLGGQWKIHFSVAIAF